MTQADGQPSDFVTALAASADKATSLITQHLQARPGKVSAAMGYATRGGKGFRAFLVLESARLHGVAQETALPAAAAIECIHAYSLIHDDLPCMDDDDMRRGQPTVHIKWDEATAVLAGDALQSLAFELLAAGPDIPNAARLALIHRLAIAAGSQGMVLGQELDIAAETAPQPLDLAATKALQAAKTGALITWAATAGAIIAGADPEPLARYGQNIGLAFQIADDILDVTASAEQTGKATGKDARAGKATFVDLLGLEGAKAEAERLIDAACAALDGTSDPSRLKQAAVFVLNRQR